ncbi:MAG: glutathione S-transferase family protein [Haliea sp.]|uniref:glutathione S-transferase family protein n=1 Tax=Haliea sp. TaxID=1932666 RepID=UPI0032EB7E1C
MLELYIANKNYSSWSLRPWLLLQQLEIPFRENLVPFRSDGSGNGFDSFSPTARVPCLHDGETVVWDSLAITEYLAEHVPQVWPADARPRAWARCASAEMHSGFQALRDICGMNCGIRVRLKSRPDALEKDLARIDVLWSEGLKRFGGPFLAGPVFTAADAFFAPVVFRLQTYQLSLSPACNEYAARTLDLPGMREWYAAALAEPWRDSAHEEEVQRVGEAVADFRSGA